ncbi:MAG TPA: SRPBCC family protein, partial [Brevundimonas sp.]
RHELWSPFARPDGKTVGEYGGAVGQGQSYSFSGGRSGQGRIRIDAVGPERVVMTLAMLKPIKATNTVEFTLAPRRDGVEVTWAMSGPQTLFGRVLGLFINCDAMCGAQFERGLTDLKTLVETGRQTAIAA